MKIGHGTLWLVKSGGTILGPYSDRQIFDLLRDRVVVPLDEVSRPNGRWIYIRDESTFKKVLDEVQSRNSKLLNDDMTTRSGAENGDVTQSIAFADAQIDDLTEEISHVPQTVQDVMFHSVEDHKVNRSSATSEVFTYQSDVAVKKQANQTSKWLWTMTSIFIILAISFVVFQRFIAKPIQNKSMINESTVAAIDALEVGNYSRAVELFSRANALDPNDSSLYLYLGILKIQIEEQPFLGRQMIEKLKAKEDKDLKRVLTGIGLAYLKEGDIAAAESSFNRAMDIDPLFDEAVINLGAAAIYKEDWAKASNFLLLAIKDGSADGAEIIMLVHSLINLYEINPDKKYLVDALKYLNEFSLRTIRYRFEIAVARAYLEFLLGNKRDIYSKVANIMDMDFDETTNHRLSLFIHRNQADWNVISKWCMKMTADLDPNATVIAFESVCLFKAKSLVEASQKIEDALLQAPKDPIVLSAHAYILNGMNSKDRLMVSVDKALKNDSENRFLQPKRMAGRLCKEKANLDCEKKAWSEILEKDQSSLVALAGMAHVYYSQNNYSEAKPYLQKGLKISNTYLPFIMMAKSISQAEDKNKSRGL